MDEIERSLRALGLGSEATSEDINQAYRDLAMVWHPDRFPNASPEFRRKAEGTLKKINEAFRVLKCANRASSARVEQSTGHSQYSHTPQNDAKAQAEPKKTDGSSRSKNASEQEPKGAREYSDTAETVNDEKANDCVGGGIWLFAKTLVTIAAVAFYVCAAISLHGFPLGAFITTCTLLMLGAFVWICRRFLFFYVSSDWTLNSTAGWMRLFAVVTTVKLFGPVLFIVWGAWATTSGSNKKVGLLRPAMRWALMAVTLVLLALTVQLEQWTNHLNFSRSAQLDKAFVSANSNPSSTAIIPRVATDNFDDFTPLQPFPSSASLVAHAAGDFLDAVLKGNTQRASSRLTPLAMQRIIASGKQFSLPGLESATFKIGEVRVPSDDQAIVQCVLTDSSKGKPHSEEMCCLLRKVGNDWRVSGIVYGTAPEEPWTMSDFESGQNVSVPRQIADDIASSQSSIGQPAKTRYQSVSDGQTATLPRVAPEITSVGLSNVNWPNQEHDWPSTSSSAPTSKTSLSDSPNQEQDSFPRKQVADNDSHTHRSDSTEHPSVALKDRFSVGSHKDEVLRLQGKPTVIKRYPAAGSEVWRYGSKSSVTVSTQTGRVTMWSNFGNLKVSQKPSSNGDTEDTRR